MDAMIKLAFERMDEQISALSTEVKQLKTRVDFLEKRSTRTIPEPTAPPPPDDVMITMSIARAILGVSRNVFNALKGEGKIKTYRVHKRTLRYSKAEIQNFKMFL